MGSLRSLKVKPEGEEPSAPSFKFTQKELLVIALGGTLEDEFGPTHLPKYLFLVTKGLNIPEERGYLFKQGSYGPSPEEPYSSLLKELEKEDLLKTFRSPGTGPGYPYYRLTKKGRELYKEIRKTLPVNIRRWLNSLTEYFHTHDAKEVVCAICNKYPEWQDGCLYYSRRNYGNP